MRPNWVAERTARSNWAEPLQKFAECRSDFPCDVLSPKRWPTVSSKGICTICALRYQNQFSIAASLRVILDLQAFPCVISTNDPRYNVGTLWTDIYSNHVLANYNTNRRNIIRLQSMQTCCYSYFPCPAPNTNAVATIGRTALQPQTSEVKKEQKNIGYETV